MSRLTVLVTSPRLPTGLLSREAWRMLETVAIYGNPASQLVPYLSPSITVLDPSAPETAPLLIEAARSGDVAWVAGPGGDEALLRRVGELMTADPSAAEQVELEVLPGSWDPPGARLLDVVEVMDRLRSPGGCPWDGEQTHASLAPYLIEEAYEAIEAIENDDQTLLREEIGDVLLQVAFHARLAEEAPDGWTIDDVAAGLVEKLIRRHPHVFGDAKAETAADVNENWESIKAAERGDKSPLSGVPMGQPALRLAAAIQRKTVRMGDAPASAAAVSLSAAESAAGIETATDAARLLWAVVARCRDLAIDAEDALRALSREVRNAVETDAAGLHDAATTQR